MRTFTTPKLRAYAALGALGLFAGVLFGRAEPAVLAAPFLLVLAAGVPRIHAPRLRVGLDVDHERVLEGDEVTAALEIDSEEPVERLEVLLRLPYGLEPAEGVSNPFALHLGREDEREVELRVRCARWGAYRVGDVLLRAHDRLGLAVHEARVDRTRPLRVYPGPEQLRETVRPRETQVHAGNQVARSKGEGIEFADLRPYVPGDRIRRINWRATARRGELWVNESHPERNSDVVLFLDTFGEARSGGRSTLDLTVRAAASLAERYLRYKDRVGLVSFGGTLNWLLPSTGLTQLYRIVDAMMESEVALSYAWKGIDMVPRRMLPPQALVLALTPLLDARSVEALLDLRARGFDLAVVEVSPVPFSPPGSGELDPLAHRVWLLERAAVRARFASLGVSVATWNDGDPFALPLWEVGSVPARLRIGARIAPAAVALVLLGGVVAYPLAEAQRLRLPLTVFGLAAVVLLVVGLARVPSAVGVAVGVAGTEYVSWLLLDARPLDGASPLVAAGLVLAAELAYRSIDGAGPAPPADGEDLRRALTALTIAVVGGAAALVLLGVADAAPASSSLLEALAVGATVGLFVLVAVLASRSSAVDSDR